MENFIFRDHALSVRGFRECDRNNEVTFIGVEPIGVCGRGIVFRGYYFGKWYYHTFTCLEATCLFPNCKDNFKKIVQGRTWTDKPLICL